MISAILKNNPSIEKGVIFDLPEVVELGKIRFAKEEPENITQRVHFVTGSFLHDAIPMVVNFIQVLSKSAMESF